MCFNDFGSAPTVTRLAYPWVKTEKWQFIDEVQKTNFSICNEPFFQIISTNLHSVESEWDIFAKHSVAW